MNKFFVVLLMLFAPMISFAHKLAPTTFAMSCVIISPDDKWTYRDYGFKLTYRDIHGKKRSISAQSTGTKKNCTQKTVSATAAIPAGRVTMHINDFVGEAGSTIECTNTMKYRLTKKNLGEICEFMVKTPKYGSSTSTDECALQVTCHKRKNKST